MASKIWIVAGFWFGASTLSRGPWCDSLVNRHPQSKDNRNLTQSWKTGTRANSPVMTSRCHLTQREKVGRVGRVCSLKFCLFPSWRIYDLSTGVGEPLIWEVKVWGQHQRAPRSARMPAWRALRVCRSVLTHTSAKSHPWFLPHVGMLSWLFFLISFLKNPTI